MIVETKKERLIHLQGVPKLEKNNKINYHIKTLLLLFYLLVSPSKVVVAERELLLFAPALHNSTVLLRVDLGDHAPKHHHVRLERLTLLTFVGWEELVLVMEVVLWL